MQDFEKLGTFYLGREFDPRKKKQGGLLLYDSKDLVTHAVCVGMTGSGKTGLCLALLEEAAIDGVPAILIDPKGDLANLLLTFPDLRGEDFLPWINEEDAAEEGPGPEGVCRSTGEALAGRPGAIGGGRRAHPEPAGGGRIPHLHAGQQRRHSGLDPEILRRPGAGRAGGYRAVAGAHQHDRHQPAWPARHRGRSDPEPRTHPALHHLGHAPGSRARTSTWRR